MNISVGEHRGNNCLNEGEKHFGGFWRMFFCVVVDYLLNQFVTYINGLFPL